MIRKNFILNINNRMFSKILYINLDRRVDRKLNIQEQVHQINWNGDIEKISAIDGRKLIIDDIAHLIGTRASEEANSNVIIRFAPGSYMTKGAVGCALSHREAWINILNGSHDKVLILEDDIRFDDQFNEKLNYYLQDTPDYDLLYIGYHDSRNNNTRYNDKYIRPENVVFGLYGYIVDKRIAQKLLDMFPIEGQIDSEIQKIYKDINVYILNEDLRIIHSDHSYDNSLGTDIQVIEGYENSVSNLDEQNDSYANNSNNPSFLLNQSNQKYSNQNNKPILGSLTTYNNEDYTNNINNPSFLLNQSNQTQHSQNNVSLPASLGTYDNIINEDYEKIIEEYENIINSNKNYDTYYIIGLLLFIFVMFYYVIIYKK